jgi:hypothetical protein
MLDLHMSCGTPMLPWDCARDDRDDCTSKIKQCSGLIRLRQDQASAPRKIDGGKLKRSKL